MGYVVDRKPTRVRRLVELCDPDRWLKLVLGAGSIARTVLLEYDDISSCKLDSAWKEIDALDSSEAFFLPVRKFLHSSFSEGVPLNIERGLFPCMI